MSERSVAHSMFVIERRYGAAPERVFAAFADAEKKRRWFAGGERSGPVEHALDFREGGRERTASRLPEGSPFPGVALINETVYLDIVPGRRIVFAYTMTLGERRISASLATVELLEAEGGTNLLFTDQGAFFEGSDGPEMRKAGWEQILNGLDRELRGEA